MLRAGTTFYLVVNVFGVERYVYSESGGIVVRPQQGLLVRFVPHHKVQVGLTLMRGDMRRRRRRSSTE